MGESGNVGAKIDEGDWVLAEDLYQDGSQQSVRWQDK